MKVILTARVSNLGSIGEVVEVKNGYAKNFLIPNGKAICFTANNQKVFESKKEEFEKANQDNLESAKKVKDKIAKKDVVIIENASDDGRLYGSVSSASIAAKINEIIGDKLVARSQVFLNKPIKEIGVYMVKIDLHSDVIFEARLVVTRSESEIDSLIKSYLKALKGELAEEENAAEVEVADKEVKKKRKKVEA